MSEGLTPFHYLLLGVSILGLISIAIVFYLDRLDSKEQAGKLGPSSSPR